MIILYFKLLVEGKIFYTDSTHLKDNDNKHKFIKYHGTVIGKYNIITYVHILPRNINDVEPYVKKIETQIKKFNFNTKYRFQYVEELDVYICINNHLLKYRTTKRRGYKEYLSNS